MLVARFYWAFSIFITSTKLKTFKLVLTYTKNVREPWLNNANCKGKAQFIFLCDPQKSSRSSANVCLMKKLKSTVIKKVIVCFCHFSEENFGKYQLLYIIFPTFNMVLFEIHQRFKRQLLNKLSVSPKKSVKSS